MSPRSILKHQEDGYTLQSYSEPFPFASCPSVQLSPHVHFPPSPILTCTHPAHSPTSYDRTPINVPPNQCELPERGGRVYSADADNTGVGSKRESYFPTWASARTRTDRQNASSRLPSLIPDFSSSSESDESEFYVGTPPDSNTVPPISTLFAPYTSLPPARSSSYSREEIDHAMSFLPCPPPSLRAGERIAKRQSSRSRARGGQQEGAERESSFSVPSLEGCLGGF